MSMLEFVDSFSQMFFRPVSILANEILVIKVPDSYLNDGVICVQQSWKYTGSILLFNGLDLNLFS